MSTASAGLFLHLILYTRLVGQKDTKTLENPKSQAGAGITLPSPVHKQLCCPELHPRNRTLPSFLCSHLAGRGWGQRTMLAWEQMGSNGPWLHFGCKLGKHSQFSIQQGARCCNGQSAASAWSRATVFYFIFFAGSNQWVLIHSHIRNATSKEGWILFQLCIKFKIICHIKALFTLYLQTLWTQGIFRGMLRTEFGPRHCWWWGFLQHWYFGFLLQQKFAPAEGWTNFHHENFHSRYELVWQLHSKSCPSTFILKHATMWSKRQHFYIQIRIWCC